MTYDAATEALEGEVKQLAEALERAATEVGRFIVGQNKVVNRLLMALIAEGHVLLEGLPGLAKTSTVRALSSVTDLAFKRIQFTPDLLPADVIGTQIYDPKTGDFKVRKGPVFTNLLLADEINRAPAKVQSALLEAMQERQVTIGDETFNLAKPFLVLATQNPIEQEGTYPLPEAQVDRFLFKIEVGYGNKTEEMEIIRRMAAQDEPELQKAIDTSALLAAKELMRKVHVADKVRAYIADLVMATRDPAGHGFEDLAGFISVGASPRAGISLEKAARVNALMAGRTFVTPQDIKDVGADILRHRVLLTYEAEAEDVTASAICDHIFQRVDVP